MQEIKSIKDIVSSKDEYDLLYNTDHIFILKGKGTDDNTLIDAVYDLEHHNWFLKLRGPHEGPAKLHNTKNNHEWLHGYVIAVSHDNLTKFEQSTLLVGIKYGYVFEKLDILQIKKDLKEQQFNSLFEG